MHKFTFEELKMVIDDIVKVDISEKIRKREYILGRMMFYKCCSLANENYTTVSIAGFLGFNHATAIHLLKRFDNDIKNDIKLIKCCQELKKRININIKSYCRENRFPDQKITFNADTKKTYNEFIVSMLRIPENKRDEFIKTKLEPYLKTLT